MAGIPWHLCPEGVRPIEQRLYELTRIYAIQNRRIMGFKKLKSHICSEVKCEYLDDIIEVSERGKKELEKLMKPYVSKHPVYTKYLSKVPGIGVVTAALLLGNIHPWRFENISKLWAWAGLAPPEYYRQKCGNSKCFHTLGKAILMSVSRSVVRNSRHYLSLFNEKLREEIAKLVRERRGIEADPYGELVTMIIERAPREYQPIYYHAVFRSYRYIAKIFAANYWEGYRMIMQLPIKPPYILFAGIRGIYYPPMIEARGRVEPLRVE